MMLTPYPDINLLLEQLVNNIHEVLGKNIAGVYLYGSLVWGDFDIEISDIDLLAATTISINEKEFSDLKVMQDDFAQSHKKWNDRIEIAYMSLNALRTFKTQPSQVAIISPGEPFNLKEAGNDWLINWYIVRERGLTLFGPSPKELIESISKAEFIEAVKNQTKDWREWIVHTINSRPYQAYAILTMCRALYAYKNGEQVSKKQAALWVMQELPQWSEQIQKALQWRSDYRNKDITHEETYPETVKFVNFIIDLVLASPHA